MKPRRNPLFKERFLEGNRQKWALVLILCGAGILYAKVHNPELDVEPFFSFLGIIAFALLFGMTGDSYFKIWKSRTPSPLPPEGESYRHQKEYNED